MGERLTTWRHRHGIMTGAESRAQAEEIGRRVAQEWADHPSTPPTLGTPEARERLRQSGVPLDEWRRVRTLDELADERRRDDRNLRVIGWTIGLVVAGYLAWVVANPGPTPAENLRTCGPAVGLPCSFEGAEGLMVRGVNVDEEVVLITAQEFDESYYSWQEEYGNDCIPGTPGGGC